MLGTTLNQRFTLDKELGRGGMGAVYRATDQILQRTVAIKVLKEITGEEVGRKLRLEAQILARLVHESIVRLYDFGLDQGVYYFIMEEVDGTSFQKRWKRLDLSDRVRVLIQTAEALDYAHHQGVIHRDVKPANILLTSTDQAKLSDFGLSLLTDATQESGVVRGTPHYMSPEQARGKKLDFRTDLYALGVILYECATGSPPYSGPLLTIMSQHVNGEPEPPRQRNPDLSADFERLILRLMSKRPEARPATGKETADLMAGLLQTGRLLAPGTVSVAASAVPEAPAGPGSNGSASSGEAGTGLATPISGRTPASGAASGPRSPSIPSGPLLRYASAAARDLLAVVEAEPILLGADERYLCGHYLAYLLGGSRRRGFLRRRPLDPLNADRARLLLAMTYLMSIEPGDPEIERCARLLDEQTDVRPALSPVVVIKYLASRDAPKKRKRFRQIRRALQEASTRAQEHLTDAAGMLNPGLMPQVLEDLRKVAPERTEIDDELVLRWNRVTEVWKGDPEFRDSVLRYATRRAYLDPASSELWPEVVYPLIERARWQRRLRSGAEVVWDAVAASLHIPDAGVRMDRAFRQAVPEQFVLSLDRSLDEFVEAPSLGEPVPDPGAVVQVSPHVRVESFHDLDIAPDADTPFVRLVAPDPFRHTLGELRALWQEAMAALRAPGGARGGGRALPIGPYRLGAVASIRARAAGQIMLQGMINKQIEMLVPSFTGGGSNSKIVIAIWLYENQSVVITYEDNMANQRFICWDAVANQQHNYDAADALNHDLFQLGLEVPDQLDRALSKRFKPCKPA